MAKIWGHRGAAAYCPENTLESFKMACEMGADGIELDIHLTSDGFIAVSHDDRIDRCSDGTGSIAEMTLEELKKHNFGKNFAAQWPGRSFALPTLDEVYALVKPYGITVNVEIKASGRECCEKALAAEDRAGMAGRVIYSSFDHFSLQTILQLRPDAVVAPLYAFNMANPWLYAASMGAKATHPHYGQLDALPEFCGECHKLGIEVHPWTVDDEDVCRRMLALGADALITNRPDLALKIRDGR